MSAVNARVIPLRQPRAVASFASSLAPQAAYLAGVARRLLGRDQGIEDLVQDVFVAALAQQDTLRDPALLRPWLAGIMVRRALRELRKARFLRLLGLGSNWSPQLLGAPEAGPEDRAVLNEVYRLLEEFSAAERVAWTLRYVQGERLEDVAALCNCSLATAKRRINAVQQVMKEALHG